MSAKGRHGLPEEQGCEVWIFCFACLDALVFFLGHQQVVSLRLTLKFHGRVDGGRLPGKLGSGNFFFFQSHLGGCCLS